MDNPWIGKELDDGPWADALVLDHDKEVPDWRCVVCEFESDTYEHFISHMEELEGGDLRKHVAFVFLNIDKYADDHKRF